MTLNVARPSFLTFWIGFSHISAPVKTLYLPRQKGILSIKNPTTESTEKTLNINVSCNFVFEMQKCI